MAKTQDNTQAMFDPNCNPKAFSLIEQPDGNWKGWRNIRGKVVEVRDYDPVIVLTRLITHEGN
jgi:hypothetical protein